MTKLLCGKIDQQIMHELVIEKHALSGETYKMAIAVEAQPVLQSNRPA